ncbi:MAG: extracellular solute-binding protein [Clostridiales bacterium]|nr:extracellular solute-binding protein [Clostridiales bacterium]
MRGFRKALTVFICAALLCGLAGCAPEPAGSEDERIVVRLTAPQNNYIEDFDTNLYKLWLEEQTGLKIEMTWLPAEDAEQIVRQQLESREGLPCAYIGFDSHDIFRSPNIQEHGEAGVILALDGLIEKHGYHLKKLYGELPEHNIQTFMTSADGRIYFMPGFSSSIITRYRQLMWVNKGWLDALGLSAPGTTDEFQAMLRAFRDEFPDRIPMAGTDQFYSKQPYDWLINAFIYNDTNSSRIVPVDGQVVFAPKQDEWREALKYVRGLYDEGLYSPLSFSQDDQQLQQMANDERDVLGAFLSPGITFTVLQNSPELMERYVGIAPIMGPEGVQLTTVWTPTPKPNGVITTACEHPEEVFKLFDLMLSEEASLMGRYGEYGVDWDFAGDGDVSIYGTPATVHIINQLWNTKQNKHLMQIGPYVSRPKYSGGVTWDGNTTDGEYINAQTALLYQGFEPDEYVGVLIYTPEEERQVQGIRTRVEAHVKEAAADFITGARDIFDDAEWGRYLAEFEAFGLEEFLGVAQMAYDRGK